MIWSTFLSRLDTVRSDIRAEKKPNEKVPVDSIHVQKLEALLNEMRGVKPVRIIETLLVDDLSPELLSSIVDTKQMGDLAACVPVEETLEAQKEINKATVVYETDVPGGGKMKVMARETPFKPKKPVLEEVEEKELGK